MNSKKTGLHLIHPSHKRPKCEDLPEVIKREPLTPVHEIPASPLSGKIKQIANRYLRSQQPRSSNSQVQNSPTLKRARKLKYNDEQSMSFENGEDSDLTEKGIFHLSSSTQ